MKARHAILLLVLTLNIAETIFGVPDPAGQLVCHIGGLAWGAGPALLWLPNYKYESHETAFAFIAVVINVLALCVAPVIIFSHDQTKGPGVAGACVLLVGGAVSVGAKVWLFSKGGEAGSERAISTELLEPGTATGASEAERPDQRDKRI